MDDLSSGDIANNIILRDTLIISGGGTAIDTTVKANGNLVVSSGGTANGITVNSGGSLQVRFGGTATDVDWTPCVGYVDIVTGANVTFVSQYSGVYYGANDQLLSHAQEMSSKSISGTDGSMFVMADGTANKTTVESHGSLHVFSGGIADNTTVSTNGGLIISGGGVANSTAVNSNGRLVVDFGGTANSMTVSDDGRIIIFSGGTANNTMVNSRGYLYVRSGGTANNTTVESGGIFRVSSGGVANETTLNSGGGIDVSSGGTVIDTTVNNGGDLHVRSGGTVTGKLVFDSGADVFVSNGGILDFDLRQAEAGGAALVNDLSIIQGTPTYTLTVSDTQTIGVYALAEGAAGFNGTITVQNTSGGKLGTLTVGNALTVDKTNYLLSLDGSSLTVTVSIKKNIFSGDLTNETKDISSEWSAVDVNVNVVGQLKILDGGTATGTTVNGGGQLKILDGGTATGTTVNGGEFYVYSGGTANNTMVNSRGCLYVYSGGTANVTTINGWSTVVVSSGGTATIAFNPWQGSYYADAGAEIIFLERDANVYYGYGNGSRLIGKTDIMESMSIESGYSAIVYSGGTANDTTVNRGGKLRISGGVANSTTIIGDNLNLIVSSGGKLTGRTACLNTIITLLSGAIVDFDLTNILPGTAARINDFSRISGSPLYTITVNANQAEGTYTLAEKADSFNKTITVADMAGKELGTLSIGETVTISDTAYTLNLVDSVLSLKIGEGDTPSPYTSDGLVVSSGTADVKNGEFFHDTLVYMGNLKVSSGGTADNNILYEGTKMYVSSGGTANGTTVNNYCEMYVIGGSVDSTMINSGGSMHVSSGGMADNTTVNSEGSMHVSSGGTTNSTTVNSGGRLYVSSGCMADSNTVNGGSMYVSSGGTANSTTVNSGGIFYISSGGVANNTTLNSGGGFVSSGGVANHMTVNRGGVLYVRSGGTVTGKMVFESGVDVFVSNGGILDFDLRQTEAGAEALINDLSVIQGTPLYTLTVDDEWKPGSFVYALANGATEFAGTISVVNNAGNELGALTVGETVKVGYDDYTLNLADGILSVTVEVPDMTPTGPTGTAEQVSWETTGANGYIVEYSTDNFEHVVRVVTMGGAVDMPDLPGETYQWRVKADANSDWAVGEPIVSEAAPEEAVPKVVQAVEDGSDDLFFAMPNGTWSRFYCAQHVGSINDWTGTNDIISAKGKGRIQNLFFGSADPNVLCLTDGENGDAIFVDDVYTELPKEIEEQTARLYRIQEIRAGAGDDIVDMTSQQFEYIGDGLTIRGGAGDDVIWANKGNNMLFGDAGNDRIVGASGDDVIAGGIGDDNMHGGGGDDVFTFCDNWGVDNVEQLAGGSVTLWFASGSESNWDAETLTYTDGENSVKVSGVTAEQVTLKFGADGSDRFAELTAAGAFLDATTERIFEESGKGMLASL